MPLFLENSFSLNNYISISNRIKKISFYYLHFLPVHSFKNLDEQYKLLPISKSNLIQREIKHKLIYFQNENEDKNQDRSGDYERNKLTKSESIDSINIDNSYLFKKNGFAKSIYHVFLSCSILHENKISFTLHDCPFISCEIVTVSDFHYYMIFPNHFTFPLFNLLLLKCIFRNLSYRINIFHLINI